MLVRHVLSQLSYTPPQLVFFAKLRVVAPSLVSHVLLVRSFLAPSHAPDFGEKSCVMLVLSAYLRVLAHLPALIREKKLRDGSEGGTRTHSLSVNSRVLHH